MSGAEQVWKLSAPVDSEQLEIEPSLSTDHTRVGLLTLVGFVGDVVIVTLGLTVSMRKVYALTKLVPAAPVPSTLKTYVPSASGVVLPMTAVLRQQTEWPVLRARRVDPSISLRCD